MKRFTQLITGSLSVITILSLTITPAMAATTPGRLASNASSGDQARLQQIINRCNNEISRRLALLQRLNTKINSDARLSTSDKASLSNEVSGEIDSLTALKTKLDADTAVTDARIDAQAIITEYRVYALIMPKVSLIRAADDQQVAESKLSALVPKLQSRIDTAKAAGKNVTSLQSGLLDMQTQLTNAQAISSGVAASVINLQPSDFNSDHKILSGYRDKLKTAQTDIRAAVSDATSIINALKNL